jgi:hypothetical protein
MSYSYNENRIAASGVYTVDFVRFALDDTDSTAYELSDEVIIALYNDASAITDQVTRNYVTAINAAKYLWRKYSKQVTFSSAGTSMNLSDRAKYWWNVVTSLQGELMTKTNTLPVLYPSRSSNFGNNW